MGRESNDDIFRINNLTVRLGGKSILEDININVKDGEMLCIVGVSGAGKTTLLNSIIGYYPIETGNVNYCSPNSKRFVSALSNLDNFKKLFGFSAQNPSFYPELSVLENLEYFASLYNLPESIKNRNIEKALEMVQLEEHGKVQAKNLSGGMKKRLDIACAIVHNPRILILDEPTSDMDPLLRIQIWSVLEDINKSGTTLIVASHFLSEIEHVCDRIVFLHNKSVAFVGAPKHFRNIHAKTKEIIVITKDGKYNLILKRIMSMPFLEVKHVLKKRGRITLHSTMDENILRGILAKLLHSEADIEDIRLGNPSMDMLFRIFVEK